MSNLIITFEDLELLPQAVTEINEEFQVSVSEFSKVDWGDFQGGTITDNNGTYSLSFPNSKRNWTNKEKFIEYFASKISSGNALFEFLGNTPKDETTTYQILANTDVKVFKYEYKAVLTQDTPIFTNPLYTTELIFDTTLNFDDSAVDNVSLTGIGTLEFDNLEVNEDPLTANKNAVIKISTTDIAQLTFTTAYIGKQFRFIKDGIEYLGTFAETSITVTEE